jgi:intracellular sulfur oxidation DsrE/DsrF family protein
MIVGSAAIGTTIEVYACDRPALPKQNGWRLHWFALTLIAALAAGNSAAGQVVNPPKNTRLVIDNALAPRPAKVVMNMDHDAFSGKLPTGLYYMELILSNYKGSNVPLEIVALFHDKAAYMLLNDAAYNRFRRTNTGNPYGQKIAELQRAGIPFELCAYTAYNNKWVNADLLPGVKVDSDVLLRLMYLTQDGYVQIQP